MRFLYDSRYDSDELRGVDLEPGRPWNLPSEILKHGDKQSDLLDIGCGTAFKLISLAAHFKNITGIDVSQDMIKAANKNIKKHQVTNITLLECNSSKLPFKDKSFDVITCMLSVWDAKEIYRLLKPDGIVIVEHVGCEDKKDFKILFGKDEKGWRGQFLDFEKEFFLDKYKNLFNEYFHSVSIKNGFWKTAYTENGIEELLHFAPIIRNFDSKKDNEAFKKGCKLFKDINGIVLMQNRILIHARNPK